MSKKELKYVKIPDGVEFEADQVEFLNVLDSALDTAMTGTAKKGEFESLQKEMKEKLAELAKSDKLEKMQEQVDKVFLKLATDFRQPERKPEVREKQLTNAWVRAFIKRDKKQLDQIGQVLLKEYNGNGWHPGDGGPPLFEDGPVVMHGHPDADPEQGAVLIPELLAAEVNRWIYQAGIARRDMRYLPFNGPGKERTLPVLLQNVIVAWVDEGGKKPKSKPYLGPVLQTMKKIAVIVPMTEEIVEDTVLDLVALLGQLIGEAIAEEEDRVFFAGDAMHPFLGVINIAGTVAGGDLVIDNLLTAPYSLPSPARAGGKYYMHPTFFATIRAARASVLADGDGLGNFLVTPPTATEPASLNGYPIVLVDQLPSVTDAAQGEPVAFFSNLQKTCVYGDKGGLRSRLLTEGSLTDAMGGQINLAEHDMVALRVYKRVGYVPVLPGGIAVFVAP